MEEDIEAGMFIEYGEYKGNLYGTSCESVGSLINAGYVCLLNPHYQALKMLRTPQTKPYVIYVKPPRFEILKETRNDARARSTFDENNSRGFTVSDDAWNLAWSRARFTPCLLFFFFFLFSGRGISRNFAQRCENRIPLHSSVRRGDRECRSFHGVRATGERCSSSRAGTALGACLVGSVNCRVYRDQKRKRKLQRWT